MNHLIIGIGATGRRVVFELRKRLMLRHGSLQPDDVLVDFALLTKAVADTKVDINDWTVLGQSMQLPERQMLVLKPENQAPVDSQTACRKLLESMLQGASMASGAAEVTWHVVGHMQSPGESGLMPGVVRLLRSLSANVDAKVLMYGMLPAHLAAVDAITSCADVRELHELMAAPAAHRPKLTAFTQGYLAHDAASVGALHERTSALAEFVYQKMLVGPSWQAGAADGLFGVGLHRLGPDVDTWQEHLSLEIAQRVLNSLCMGQAEASGDKQTPQASAAKAIAVVDANARDRQTLGGDVLHQQVAAVVAAGTFEQIWTEYADHFKRLAFAMPDGQRMDQIAVLFDQALRSGFRGKGVEPYFEQAREELEQTTDARVHAMESDLLKDWQAGRRSLRDCGQAIATMAADLTFYSDQIEATVRQRSEVADHHGMQLAALTQKVAQSSGSSGGFGGFAKRLTGGDERSRVLDLDNAVMLWRERCLAMTQVTAGRFAQHQAQRLVSQLNALFHVIESTEQTLVALSHELRGRSEVVYERKRMDLLRERLLTREALVTLDVQRLQDDLFEAAGPGMTFRAFASVSSLGGKICQHLLGMSVQTARQFIDGQASPSLVDGLMQRWLKNQAQQAQTFSNWVDNTALADQFRPDSPPARWSLLMPNSEMPSSYLSAFAESLESTLKDKKLLLAQGPHAKLEQRGSFPGLRSDQRLTLVGLLPLFQIGGDAQLVEAAPVAAVTAAPVVVPPVPTPATTMPAPAPALLVPPPVVPEAPAPSPEWLLQVRRVLLLAEAVGLISEDTDPANGEKRLLWQQIDEDGFDIARKVLGRDWIDAVAHAEHEVFEALKKALLEPDQIRQIHAADRQEALRNSMRRRIEAIRSAAPASELDAVSLAWSEAARAAMRFVRQEAML
ncbi:MAG: hypothetical protein AB3X36_00260 [Leptothrix ochracea]|uniref:hypothetical protein n=1 Tax=Leptothrix ochracea TaxID=735331 RepID=UPI0034E22ADA